MCDNLSFEDMKDTTTELAAFAQQQQQEQQQQQQPKTDITIKKKKEEKTPLLTDIAIPSHKNAMQKKQKRI
jgi:hypothetical protein